MTGTCISNIWLEFGYSISSWNLDIQYPTGYLAGYSGHELEYPIYGKYVYLIQTQI